MFYLKKNFVKIVFLSERKGRQFFDQNDFSAGPDLVRVVSGFGSGFDESGKNFVPVCAEHEGSEGVGLTDVGNVVGGIGKSNRIWKQKS
jgi:hypothetical protein